jgi:beta-N-acetylhexosaminidase
VDIDTVDTIRTPALPALGATVDGQRAIAEADTIRQPAVQADGRALADIPTRRLRAAPRAAPSAAPSKRTWLARVGLVLLLAALGLRAGYASLALMAPGGILAGWSLTPPKPPCPLCGVSAVTGTGPSHRQVLTPADYAAQLVQKLSLDQELGQMLIVQWVGPGMDPAVTQMITQQGVGGVLLKPSDQNVVSAGQIQQLTAQLQAGAGIPLMVSIDQEGGCCTLNRLEGLVGPLPGPSDLTDPTAAYNAGTHVASLLNQYGFNLNLAPITDVCQGNQNICFRTFGSDPAQVAALVGAYVQGLQNSGQVIACLKHFPGVGAASGNPDNALTSVTSSKSQWENTDLAPYRALIPNENIQAIMVTHVLVPNVDPNLPASLSPTIITDVLRGELGFQGVIITDDLRELAAYSQYSVPQAAVLSVKAGADVLMGAYGPTSNAVPLSVPGNANVSDIIGALKQALQSGQLTRTRIDDAATHILTLKLKMGLIPMPYQGPYPARDLQLMQSDLNLAAPVVWIRGSDSVGQAA